MTDYGTLEALEVWWDTQTALKALVTGGKLWHLEAPEGANVEPYLTYFLVSETEDWTTGFAYRTSVFQFNVHHYFADTAEEIAWTIAEAMSSLNPSGGAAITIHGQAVVHVLPDSFNTLQGDGLGTGGRDCWIRSFEVEIPWTG